MRVASADHGSCLHHQQDGGLKLDYDARRTRSRRLIRAAIPRLARVECVGHGYEGILVDGYLPLLCVFDD